MSSREINKPIQTAAYLLVKSWITMPNNKQVNISLQTCDESEEKEPKEKEPKEKEPKERVQKENVEDVMKDLEEKVNPKSVSDGLSKLSTAIKTNEPSILLNPMQAGAKEFEERVGRPMTYGEMRAMWG